VYSREHSSHNQKKMLALEGLVAQIVFGTSLQGWLGWLMTKRYKRPPRR
jgi:hypothetical protein